MGQVHVKEGYELYQIITDFGDPLEIFREGIQNSFDENALEIYVNFFLMRMKYLYVQKQSRESIGLHSCRILLDKLRIPENCSILNMQILKK